MNQLEKFFEQGVSDQLKVMGSTIKIKSMPSKELSKEFVAVITERTGDLQAEVGGAVYTVNAHALIPLSCGFTPKVTDHILSKDNEYIIVSVVRSIVDKAYACDLVRI